jgi:serralysin
VLTGTSNLDGTGNELANTITGNSGDNHLYGLGGNDILKGGAGDDVMAGGAGNDVYYVDSAGDSVTENAGEGIDTVDSSLSFTLGANVERLTLTGAANIEGTGNELANILTGNSGDNHLYGLAGDDRLSGGAGNDTLDGGTGLDRLYGGAGNDTYYINNTTAYAYENAGEGTDRVYATVSVTLRANVEDLVLNGTSAINGYGNDSANQMTGNSAVNLLQGGGGDDKLLGGAGNDVVKGDAGNDWIEGGAGQDRLYGGTGSDSFVFRDGDFGGATTATADHIYDFSQSDHDHLRLSLVDADTTLAGDQAFHFLGTDAFDGSAGALHYAEISGNTYVSGDTNGDGTADFMIRIDGLHTLTSGDFVL